MTPPTLSVALIVKNEESCLASCLDSVRDADEIVVVDTGSTDKTKDIASRYTDKIFDWAWQEDFSAARNQALSHVTGDWVLSIDADETLEKDGIAKIRQSLTGGFKTLSVRVVAQGTGAFHYFPRVFRRDPSVFWKGVVHETLSVVENNRSDIQITYGSSEAHRADPDRVFKILRREVAKNPSAVREVFYLAREYWYRKDYITAAFWYEDYLTRATWRPEKADALLMLARCYWLLSKGSKAREQCLQAIGLNPDFREALLFMSEITWPDIGVYWRAMAERATNHNVLFIRTL